MILNKRGHHVSMTAPLDKQQLEDQRRQMFCNSDLDHLKLSTMHLHKRMQNSQLPRSCLPITPQQAVRSANSAIRDIVIYNQTTGHPIQNDVAY